MRVVALGIGSSSTSAAASSVVPSRSRNFLVASNLLVSLCSRDSLNGSLEVGT